MPTSRRLILILESNTDRRLLEGLAERFAVTVLARSSRVSEFAPVPASTVRILVGPASRLRYLPFVISMLLRERPLAVITQGYGVASLAGNIAARLTGTWTAMLVCNPMESYYRCRRLAADPDRPFRARELVSLRTVAWLNARLGQRYLVLSHHLARVVRAQGARCPIDVVPIYGVDTDRFSAGDGDRTAARARRGVPQNEPLVFFSSRIAPEKDAETLLRAVALLAGDGRRVSLLYRGREHERLMSRARVLGIADHLVVSDMEDPCGALNDDYRACDVCVQASRDEGLGFAALEALACLTPVIAAAVGGLRETIIDGETGWTYPVGDHRALARTIATVLDQPEEGRRRAAEGRRLVERTYRRDAVFARLDALIDGSG